MSEIAKVMGLFDFMKERPAYEIVRVEFYGGGRGSSPDHFGTGVPRSAELLVPRVTLFVNRAVELRFKVCIRFPQAEAAKGGVEVYDIEYEHTARLHRSPDTVVLLQLPASEVHFSHDGLGVLHIYDMDGGCIAAGFFYVQDDE